MSQPEARLQRRIVAALRAAGIPAWRIRPMGIDGWPDLYALRDGAPYHMEVKRPGEVPEIMIYLLPPGATGHPRGKKYKKHERRQVVRLEELRAAGATVGVVTSVEEALEVVGQGPR